MMVYQFWQILITPDGTYHPQINNTALFSIPIHLIQLTSSVMKRNTSGWIKNI